MVKMIYVLWGNLNIFFLFFLEYTQMDWKQIWVNYLSWSFSYSMVSMYFYLYR